MNQLRVLNKILGVLFVFALCQVARGEGCGSAVAGKHAEPGFWDKLHHAVSTHMLRNKVQNSDLPAVYQELAISLDSDSLDHGQHHYAYLLGSQEFIVDIMQKGILSFERFQSEAEGTAIGYRIAHVDGTTSYILATHVNGLRSDSIYVAQEGAKFKLTTILEHSRTDPGQNGRRWLDNDQVLVESAHAASAWAKYFP